jgi:hypothetical protein
MSIALGFAPFIAFFVMLKLVSPLAGLATALAISALSCLRMWRARQSIKILEVGSLALFGALIVYTVIAAPVWSAATVKLTVDTGLLAIALVSLAIGQPFSLQYARERVPQALWASPVFLHANRMITTVWAVAFAIHAAADAAAEYLPAVPLGVEIVVSIAALLAALWFTSWYPQLLRRRAAAAG